MQEENNPSDKKANLSESEMSEQEIDETLAESFPASDPPSWTLGTNHLKKPSIQSPKID